MEINDNQLLQIAKEAIREKVVERFTTQWSSPLNKLADEVVLEYSPQLKAMFEDCLKTITTSKGFKETVKTEFVHKVAKSLVGKLEGTVEKAVDKLKNDPTLKARMILAIEEIINNQEGE
jgi:hypothetical protein